MPEARRLQLLDEVAALRAEKRALLAEVEVNRFSSYRDRPVEFVREVLREDLWAKQEQILRALHQYRRVVVTSCFDSGKTHVAGRGLAHWVSTDPRAIAITTAAVGRQVVGQLWGEVRNVWRAGVALPGRMEPDPLGSLPGEILPKAPEWMITPGRNFAMGFATNDPNRFTGWHGGRVLVILDEAEGINDDLWDIMEGQLASADVAVLALGNPDPEGIVGGFQRAASSPLWHHIQISAFDTPNLVGGRDDIAPWLITRRWVEERRQAGGDWSDGDGDPSKAGPLWVTKVLGQFVEGGSSKNVVPLRFFTPAIDRPGVVSVRGEPVAGLDVARYGCFDDQTEILTDEGWKMFVALSGAEQVMTLRPDCVAEWGPITKVHRYSYEGWMNLHDGEKVNYCVTDNHRMAWRRRTDAEDSFRLDRYDSLPHRGGWIIKRSNTWEGKTPETITFRAELWGTRSDAQYQREYKRRKRGHGARRLEWVFDFLDWAEFLGWFVSEGNVYQEKRASGRQRVLIAQRDDEKMKAIENLLNRMGIRWRRTSTTGWQVEFCNNSIGGHLIEYCGSGAHNKRIPAYLKEAGSDALEAFIGSFLAGDGTQRKNGKGRNYGTSSRLLADDIQEVLVKLGRAGRVRDMCRAGSSTMIEGRHMVRTHTIFNVGEWSSKRDAWVGRTPDQRVWYEGDVHCVSTPNGTMMVRRKGVPMWSGNSDDSALAIRQGEQVIHLERIHGFAGPEVGGWALERMSRYGCRTVNGDSGGLGGPVLDFIRLTPGIQVNDVNAGERAHDPEKFVRKRDELWWGLRERFEQNRIVLPTAKLGQSVIDELKGEVTPVLYFYRLGGRIEVESKDSMKKRGLPSPDLGDSLCLSFYGAFQAFTNLEQLSRTLV